MQDTTRWHTLNGQSVFCNRTRDISTQVAREKEERKKKKSRRRKRKKERKKKKEEAANHKAFARRGRGLAAAAATLGCGGAERQQRHEGTRAEHGAGGNPGARARPQASWHMAPRELCGWHCASGTR